MRIGRRETFGLALVAMAPALARPVRAAALDEHVIGDANAPVTMIEYSSLSCPHCAAFHKETLPVLKERYIDTGKVKLVLRDFPLEPNALRAAMLAHCAGPERYARFVEVYFRQQESWAHGRDPMAGIKQLAKLGGLGDSEIEACLANKSVEDGVLQTRLEGQNKYGVQSTPTFIINGKTYPGNRSVDEFAKIIDPLLG